MADEKGGSTQWGPFEIVLAIILLIGLLNQLGSPQEPKKETPKQIQKTVAGTPPKGIEDNSCGLDLSSPKPLGKVNSSVIVKGSTNGCRWESTDEVALYAQVIDPAGMPISEYLTVPPVSREGQKTVFNFEVPIVRGSTKGTAYLILISAKNFENHTISTRVPIKL